jgi:hypothetical protein
MPVYSTMWKAHTGMQWRRWRESSPEDDLEAHDADLKAHGSSIQVALCTNCKLAEALHVRDDTSHNVQPDLPASSWERALKLHPYSQNIAQMCLL